MIKFMSLNKMFAVIGRTPTQHIKQTLKNILYIVFAGGSQTLRFFLINKVIFGKESS
ncbi:hypothetical protein PB1_10989 [Bacillus methanolicus PB1]|uniref:Uncharacterized protein n=1 Tax=Bacillus methanolicus PB1 TaxID=997296 RepID=I3DV09_BACMT|nr:hypothetical protein PB1_10989 [Bacillus methanolicus PB1]